MNEDLNNKFDNSPEETQTNNNAAFENKITPQIENSSSTADEKKDKDNIESNLNFDRTYSAGELGIELPSNSELGDLKSQYSVLSSNKHHNSHSPENDSKSESNKISQHNEHVDDTHKSINENKSNNQPLAYTGHQNQIPEKNEQYFDNQKNNNISRFNFNKQNNDNQELSVSEARSEKARSFALKIEDDIPYRNASGNDSFFNTMLTSQSLAGKNVDGNGLEIDKDVLKEQERAFYEAENKRNHPEEKHFSAKHNKRKSPKNRLKRGNGCMPKIIIGIIVIVCSIVLSYFTLLCVNDLLGLFKEDDLVVVTIPESVVVYDKKDSESGESETGDSSDSDEGYIPTRAIAEILADEGLIDQPEFFILFSKIMHYDGDYQTGTFGLNAKDGYEGMIKELQYREKMAETVNITFPEGMTIEEIATKLEEKGVCSKDVFIEALKNSDYSDDFAFTANIPETEGRYYKYEGYLFPDTYNFYVDSTVDNAIAKFLEGFENHWTEEYQNRADELGMTMDEVITLASIVQKEAGVKDEMKRVASVFHNRLNSDYQRLESDPTVFYYQNCIYPYIPAEDEATREFYSEHYSTYKCVGLPAGAISNPGTAAIEAVLYPEDTPYLYFVTDAEGNYYYAETYSEHLANCEKAGI